MSNSGTYIVNLGKAPEKLELGGRECYKLRCAEKAGNKKAITRWFTAIVGGPDAGTAARLAQGDTIAVTGELSLTEYKNKKTREMVKEDEMPFAKIMRVIKSPSFFAGTGEKAESDEGAPTADAPEGDTPPDLSGLD
jgi:single-stranded DNA-binding protein